MKEFLTEHWQLLIPIVLIDIGLKVFALVDLQRRESVVGGKKWPWALVVVGVNLFGPVIYLALGRRD